MKTEMELWAVKLGASLLLAALLVLASAWLPLGLASNLAAQEKDSETETTVAPNTTPFPYSALQACNVGMELSAGEGCHVSGTGTSFVVGRGSGCIVLFEPSLLAICHAATTDSSSVLSASKGDDGSWTIEDLADAPDGCGELTGLHEAVRLGNAEWVACLAATGAEVNARDERGDTPLHIAVEKGSVELTQILIDAGVDVGLLSYEESPVPIGLSDLAQVFASAGSDASLQDAEIVAKAEPGVAPLQVAIDNGDLELVQMLVVAGMATPEPAAGSSSETGPEPAATPAPTRVNPALSQEGFMGSTLLHDAIEEGDQELVQMLVEAGADVNMQGFMEATPLHEAIRKGYVDIVRILVEAGADVDMPGFMEATPLHEAIEEGYVDIVRILVEAGADVNKPGHMGTTPLASAVAKGDAEILEILIAATTDVEPEQPLSIEDTAGQSPLIVAVEDGDVELVQTLIASGSDLNATDAARNTPLHIAVRNGDTELVRILIQAGADILAKNAGGQTPLTIATESGDLDMVRLLLNIESNTPEATPEAPAEADA